jgi:hypothetical protein
MYNLPGQGENEAWNRPSHIESQYVDSMHEAETTASFLAQQFNRVQVYLVGEQGHEALFEYLNGRLHLRNGYVWV